MKFKEMNLPNKLTTLRMFCVPFMIVLFIIYMILLHLAKSHLWILLAVMTLIFVLASITDFVDGHIARKYNLVSDYGKLMDPLADKLLVNTTIICMLASNMFYCQYFYLSLIAIIMAIIVIARDIFVDALRMQALKKNAVVPASMWGKLKTATLMPGIAVLLLGSLHIVIQIIGLVLISLGGLFALIGGIDYFKKLSKFIGD